MSQLIMLAGILALSFVLITFLSLSGFLVSQTPVYYAWVTRINFFHYANTAIVKNEFQVLITSILGFILLPSLSSSLFIYLSLFLFRASLF